MSIFMRIMMLLGVINMIKYLDINFPPNVIEMFLRNNGSPALIYTYEFTVDEKDLDTLPQNYLLYNVSPYLLDNIGDALA